MKEAVAWLGAAAAAIVEMMVMAMLFTMYGAALLVFMAYEAR